MNADTVIRAKVLRSPAELREAGEALKRAGYDKCDSCQQWSNEDQRTEASGSARGDTRCAHCGANWSLLSRQDAAS